MTPGLVLDWPALVDAADDVAELLDDTGAPVTAQWWWVRRWAMTHPAWRCWALVVPSSGDGLAAGAVLAERRRGPLSEIVPAGYGQSDYPWFAARSAAAAADLASAFRDVLGRRSTPWRLVANELPADDPVVLATAQQLPHAEIRPGVGSPVLDLPPGFDVQRDLPASSRKEVNAGRNRLARDGRRLDVELVRDAERLAVVLADLERVRRDRDVSLRGSTDIEDEANLLFWQAVLTEAAERGVLDVTMLRVDGAVAGYLAAFVDGSSYRIWDTRLNPEFRRYSVGHLARDEVLRRVAQRGDIVLFDWMRGLEPYKMRTANRVMKTERLVAWSSGWLRRAEQLARKMKPPVNESEA